MGIVAGAITAGLGIAKFRQSKKVDATSAQSGAASNHRAGTQQVIDGLNSLLDQAQETIKDDRDVITLLEGRIGKFALELDACRKENARLRRIYGVTDENGPTKPVES